ncbi:phosphopyruvate hydratase [Patescibacteria group bacterium]|nr:phosphopyruvate hydratase [Patescibacteria group bacterium]
MQISSISANEILASGGYPTIEVIVTLDNGVRGRSSVPYGASAGSHEATVLVDGDESRYNGKGVKQAVANVVEKIFPLIKNIDPQDQRALDQAMIDLDGTPNKANLGGNAILAVSLAVAKAVAKTQGKPFYEYIRDTYQTGVDFLVLPQPMVVVIEGGKHADETTDLQEYCISAVGNGSVMENVRKTMEAYHQLRKILKKNGLSINVGNEGAFAPNGIPNNEAPFEYIVQAIIQAGYKPGEDLAIAVDAAASEFYQDGKYNLAVEKRILNAAELIAYYEGWLKKYPIVSYEDMLAEDDWENWTKLNQVTKKYGVEHIGDDLTATNMERLQKAIDLDAMTAILIKLNQAGTLTETVDTCMLARKNNMATVTSHRGGGETNDTSMVDLAVAVGSRFVKVGPTRGERVCKYNRLMEIERETRG